MESRLNDISVSGSGKIGGGDYNNIRISGSGKLTGDITAKSIHVSGSAHAQAVKCDELHVSGSAHTDGELVCLNGRISGSIHTEDNVYMEEVSVSGSFHAGKNIKCGSLRVSGSIKAENDVESEKVRISGLANIGGLLNAEEIEIVLSGNGTSRISEIGGDRIAVHAKESQAGNFNLLRIFGKPFGRAELKANSIEGTTVYLTNTECAVVRGKTVYIDAGCRIGRVEYENSLEIHDSSIVDESIKL